MRALLLFCCCLVVACADDEAGSGDVGSSDLRRPDVEAGHPDAASGEADAAAGRDDAGIDLDAELSLDSSEAPDAASPDAQPDASEPTDGLAADSGCDYIDLDAYIIKCPSGFRYAYRFGDIGEVCPDYYQLGAFSDATLGAVIEAAGCDPACQYAASMSVSFIDPCERRNGYIVFRAHDDEQCPPVYEFAEGLFPSVEAWEAQLNCGG